MKRSKIYYQPVEEYCEKDFEILATMDEIYTECPFYGYRRIHKELFTRGFYIGKDRVLRYMKVLGIEALYPKKNTTIRNKEHKIYPYLLKHLKIDAPGQVWATDITYIKMEKGFCYLTAVIDWYSKKILAHRISNSMDTSFCLEVLEEALAKNPKPMVFNTDQGSQFTSDKFTGKLLEKGILISMDSKGRATDNAVIERFWRTIKYEDIFLKEYTTIQEVKNGVAKFIDFYNNKRLHSSLGYQVPSRVHANLKLLEPVIEKVEAHNLETLEKSIA